MKKVKVLIALIIMSLFFIPNIYGYEIGREVYVRHIDKDTGTLINGIENINQVLENPSKQLSLVANDKTKYTGVDQSTYSEYYEFPLDSTMMITKSLVMLTGGYNYTYIGYVKKTTYTYDDSFAQVEDKRKKIVAGIEKVEKEYDEKKEESTTYTFTQSNENDVTIVDFYYTKSNTEDVSVKLKSWSSATPSDATLINTDITYAPAASFLYPYYEAPRYYATELSYVKVLEGNKLKYKVGSYIVNVARRGTMYNSSPIVREGKTIYGNVIGHDRNAVINVNLDELSVDVSSDIGELTKEINLAPVDKVENYNTKTNQKLITGSNLGKDDFPTSGWSVEYKVYNGLRSAKGSLIYETYNVLTGEVSGQVDKASVNDHFINVFTPIKLDTPIVTITSERDPDHSSVSPTTIIMEDDATFDIELKCSDSCFFNGVSDVDRYRFITHYYLVFDFDVIHNNRIYSKGTAIRMTANQFGPITHFYGQVAPNETLSRESSNHKIIIMAAASNMPDTDTGLLQEIVDQEVETQMDGTRDVTSRKYINGSGDNEVAFSTNLAEASQNHKIEYTGGQEMYADGYYFAMKTVVVRTASRIFDFRITDCTDLAFKSSFRDANNNLINTNYYSGTRRLFVYTNGTNKEYTSLLTRDNNDLYIYGTSSTKTLPLGPYKHNTATYIKAPKLGYRIAFDLKTSGFYLPDGNDTTSRKILIKPTYYYVSKDGREIKPNIDLYYKDQSGQYKKFVNSGYNIYFTPNDGYRVRSTSASMSTMSKQSIVLNISNESGFELNDRMMTTDDSNYIQTWYGEFKLPNTTIAVENGSSVDNYLKDGYIGVKFSILCTDSILNESIDYNASNKNVPGPNTTQWDYEGYLGFSNLGQPVNENASLRLQLEKGILVISTQEQYDLVKGTVILYDTDERAADDIN